MHSDHKHEVKNLETETKKRISIELKDELAYLTSLYNTLHKSYRKLNGSDFLNSGRLTRALLLLLGRISDYLRSIHVLVEIGYPEQSGTLAASIFELAHTAYYFTHNANTLSSWFKAGSIEQIKQVLGKTWYSIVKENFNTEPLKASDPDLEYEYQIYTQLCWMKHALPSRQEYLFDENCKTVKLDLCPKSNENALRDARFVTFSTGQQIEFFIITLCRNLQNNGLENDLISLRAQRFKLLSTYQSLYGTQNPFDKEHAGA